MGLGRLARGGIPGLVIRWAGRLRFPWLFALTAVVFVVNLFIPDALPFADEIVMGLVAVLLGSLKRRGRPRDREGQPGEPGDPDGGGRA